MNKDILSKLKNSKFRSSFRLNEKEMKIIKEKGIDTIKKHTEEILNQRIRKKPQNDGRQTPWRRHPVFVAQHATAICCRKCIEKWHGFNEEKILNDSEINYLSDIITRWILIQSNSSF